MQIKSSIIIKGLIVISAGVLLSACLPSQTDTSPVESSSVLTTLATPVASATPQLMNDYKELTDFAPIEATQATLVTTKGEITFKLFRQEAPLTTANFLDLAASGFYDGVVFHRVIEDFMAQVGDPLSKDPAAQARWGTGGPDYRIQDEFGVGLAHDKPGMVSMANSGPNTGGSQFFITHVPTPWLDGKHAIFGEVTEGLDILLSIGVGDKILSIKLQ